MKEPVDLKRRKFLLKTSSVLGGIGLAYVAYPFLASWEPSERALAAGAPVTADVSKLLEGESVVYEWRGKPVVIVRRSQTMVEGLNTIDAELRDPSSNESEQPVYAKNPYRSRKPEFFVAVNICTHLGCTPLVKPTLHSLSPDWPGGFFCPCHGSKYDLAGRVFKDVPAPLNLVIPKYKYVNDTQPALLVARFVRMDFG